MARVGPDRVKLIDLAIFSSPVLVMQAIELPWRIFLPAFFATSVGIDLAAVGTLMLAIRLFDMVADPLVGWASDRFSTRIGARRPWMIASVPLILLGTWHVFFAHPGIGFAALALWCGVLHLGYTLLIVPHGGWGLELARTYHERTRIMAAKTWFAAAAIPLILLVPAVLERFTQAGREEEIAAMGWMLMLLTPVSVALVVCCIAEPQAERATSPWTEKLSRPRRAVSALRGRTIVLLLYALVGMADAAAAASFLFFVEQALGLERMVGVLILIPALVALLSLPVWAAISRRVGKRGALAMVLAWQAVVSPAALLLPPGQLAPLIGFLVLRSFTWCADYMLLRAIVADLAAGDTAASGERWAATYYAAFNVTLKFAAAIGVGAALWTLARSGFVPGSVPPRGAIDSVRLVYALPSCLAGLIGLTILLLGSTAETSEVFRDAPA